MSFVGTTLLFLGGGLSFVVSVSSFVCGGLICGWWIHLRAVHIICGWGADVCGRDYLVGGGCYSGVRGRLFVVLSSCCVVHVVAVSRGWGTDGYLLERPRW